jgi:hypothetical protein
MSIAKLHEIKSVFSKPRKISTEHHAFHIPTKSGIPFMIAFSVANLAITFVYFVHSDTLDVEEYYNFFKLNKLFHIPFNLQYGIEPLPLFDFFALSLVFIVG